MIVAVIGGGGREHAIAWRLSISPSVTKVVAIPGSDGMGEVAKCIPLDWRQMDDLVSVLRAEAVDLVVIGPEDPLVEGLGDALREEGFPVFGPSKGAAALEGSKEFAKTLMSKYGVPTAAYAVFTNEEEAKQYAKEQNFPMVIKADGLASGKGVVIAETLEEGLTAIEDMFSHNRFGKAGHKIVIEEYMEGEEVSVLAFVDGHTIIPMVAAQDHKRIFDGDKGDNTGGMGAYAPAPILTPSLAKQVQSEILTPVVEGLKREGLAYEGCLYAGLMITSSGPKVVEFNVRFGDPETQVILPLLASDFGSVLWACTQGSLDSVDVSWHPYSAACVVLAAEGYPGKPTSGDCIHGLMSKDGTYIFHSGTKLEGDTFVTAGGRVLGIVACGENLSTALDAAYERIDTVSFRGMQFRKDIGRKGLLKAGRE